MKKVERIRVRADRQRNICRVYNVEAFVKEGQLSCIRDARGTNRDRQTDIRTVVVAGILL